VRLKEHSYVRGDARVGDIVEAPFEEAQRLFDMGVAEPATEGERRFLDFANQICDDLEQ